MHRTILTTAALCGLLAVACGEKPSAETDTAKAPAPVVEPKADGPAGEVGPDTRTPTEMKGNLPDGVDPHFAPYFEKVPFTWGIDAGLAKAKAEGKPAMLFYSALN